MRKIYCEECGKMKPTHPEDAALGFFPRRTHGQVINELVCDACGKEMPKGTNAVAESVPRDMKYWENEYLAQCPNDELSEPFQESKHERNRNHL